MALLATISPDDVLRLAVPTEQVTELDDREAWIALAIDDATTVETLVETIAMPTGELLGVLCDLCARGILTLTSGRRRAR